MIKIEIFDDTNIGKIPKIDNTDFKYALEYLKPLVKNNVEEYIENVSGQMKLLVIEDKWIIPMFIPLYNKRNSYVASLYNHYISYGIEELKELKQHNFEWIYKILLKALGVVLKSGKIDKCLYINNWLLSTNLYTDIPSEYIKPITEYVSNKYKGYSIVWNSINKVTTRDYYEEMKRNSFLFLPSRSIYIQNSFPIEGKLVKRDVKKDLKLLNETEVKIKKEIYDDTTIELYNNLYIYKYSKYNPKFTRKFLKLLGEKRLLDYYSLKDNEDKTIGILGFFTRQKILTTPVLGYDTTCSTTEGLYRILAMKLYLECKDKNHIQHASSGVGNFKMSRGAERHWEYRAIYLDNVNVYRKLIYKFLGMIICKVAVPMMDKKQL